MGEKAKKIFQYKQIHIKSLAQWLQRVNDKKLAIIITRIYLAS